MNSQRYQRLGNRSQVNIARYERLYEKLLLDVLNMASADSMAKGLAQSQDMKKERESFNNYEDPARCWIDLVAAFKSGQPAQVRSVLSQAKASRWTHDVYNEALQEAADYSTDDAEDLGWPVEEDTKKVKDWQEINAAQEEYWEQ